MDKSTALDKILSFAPCKDSGSQGDDAGASGESSGIKQIGLKEQVAEVPSTSQNNVNNGPGIACIIGYFILRAVFYLAALTFIVFGGLYTAKLFGIYDPCEKYYVANNDCKVTPYMKGLLYHVECVEERNCYLPGFWTASSRKDWSLKNPSSKIQEVPNP